jgi:diguanylate cyclase (GGDEF)-like protein
MMSFLREVLDQRNLTAVFQPIIGFTENNIIGFEGLIRGPVDSPLHSPIQLFAAASAAGLMLEMETLSRQVVIESFAVQQLPGKLFLNVSPKVLLHPSFKSGQTLAYLNKFGISPDRVVIEITENQPTIDFDAVYQALEHYRGMGFQIAIDDLGAGFSSLRLWSELRPDFVKIDMHFVQGSNSNQVKQQFLRSIQQIARSCGTDVIAEGIETEAELRVIRNIGIACGQGYLIARPLAEPLTSLSNNVVNLLRFGQAEKGVQYKKRNLTVESILRHVEAVHPETLIEDIFTRLSAASHLHSIPVVKNCRPVGLINRYEFVDSFARPFRRELFSKKPCAEIMRTAPLLVEKSTLIHELSGFLSETDAKHFIDGFVITQHGHYVGIGTGQDLLREITKTQIENARYANPLTLLPGNVPISEYIDELLQQDKPFAVCYADLDHFKPFNDVYGYRKGDEIIQMTGKLLSSVCDPQRDFIGHIGGDDFILVLQSEDWEVRCHRVLSNFARRSVHLLAPEHLLAGGYSATDRQGRVVRYPLPTLSIGVVLIDPEQFSSHYEVSEAATAAKKMAKSKIGNSLFIERRRNFAEALTLISSTYKTTAQHDDLSRIA